jgi:hypothetical protein
VHVATGRFEQAIEAITRAVESYPALSLGEAALAFARGRGGDTEFAAAAMRSISEKSRMEYVSPYALAICAMGADKHPEVLAYLREAVDQRAGGVHLLRVEPIFDDLRSEPKYGALLHAMRLQP